MKYIESLADLQEHNSISGDTSLRKVAPRMTPEYRARIMRSRFCELTTVGPEGTNGTPFSDEWADRAAKTLW